MGTNNNSVTLQVHPESHTISPCIKREWFHLLLQEKLATQQLFLNQGALLVPKEVFFLQAVIPCNRFLCPAGWSQYPLRKA